MTATHASSPRQWGAAGRAGILRSSTRPPQPRLRSRVRSPSAADVLPPERRSDPRARLPGVKIGMEFPKIVGKNSPAQVFCPVVFGSWRIGMAPARLMVPARRIGQRWGATRAPTQGTVLEAEPLGSASVFWRHGEHRAAGCRPGRHGSLGDSPSSVKTPAFRFSRRR